MLIIALLFAQAAVAHPSAAEPSCVAYDKSLPAPLAGWTSTLSLDAGGVRLEPGAAVTHRTIDPAAPAAFAVALKRPGRYASFMFTVTKPGRYSIALDQPGWIDVRPVSGKPDLVSVAHAHGPACSTIRKMVSFDLMASAYYLSLTGLANPTAKIMLVKETK